jgi:type I restriction enzyme R subunit|tara:strand:+ start:1127 stop:1339 length:213 start_codon:yes stop_codon:yes gene_type:complete
MNYNSLMSLLEAFPDDGISSIENPKVLKLKPFSDMGTPMEIINDIFGGKTKYESTIEELERELFNREMVA